MRIGLEVINRATSIVHSTTIESIAIYQTNVSIQIAQITGII